MASRSGAIKNGFLAGSAAGAAILAALVLLQLVLPVATPAELLWDFEVGLVPGPVFSALLDALHYAAKPLFLVALTAVQLFIAGFLGIVYALIVRRRPIVERASARWPWWGGGIYGIVLSMVCWAVVNAQSAAVSFLTIGAASTGLIGWGLLQALLLDRLNPSSAEHPMVAPIDLVRRDLLVKGVLALITVSAGDLMLRSVSSVFRSGISIARRSTAKLSTYITPNDEFYRVSKNLNDPVVDTRTWHLEIKGLVATPLHLTLDDLKALPAVTNVITLECISNEIGGDLMGNAVWRGVRLRDLLTSAGIEAQAIDIALQAADGYEDSIPVAKAMEEATLLAYEMNGVPLPPGHGFPVRLLVPGIYGMKNVKWITVIEPVKYDFRGYWQEQGWSDVAEVQTTARIDVPTDGEALAAGATLGGVAFAGNRGISRVEVSSDGGKTWQAATLGKTDSPYTWVIWLRGWPHGISGGQTVLVRAVDGRGAVQEARVSPPFPNGATGYHKITVRIAP